MEIHHFFDARTFTLTYVVFDPETADAVVIDPVLDYDPLAGLTSTESIEAVSRFLQDRKLSLRWVLETHAHADHLSGSQYLRRRFDAGVAIGARITEVQETFKAIFDLPEGFRTDGSQFDRLLVDGEVLRAGSLAVEVISTPGHTPACVTYQIGEAIFTGDALFMEDYGTGRCDFPRGSAADLYDSVHGRLYALPDATRVFVGHDYQPGGRALAFESTIGREKEANVQLQDRHEQGGLRPLPHPARRHAPAPQAALPERPGQRRRRPHAAATRQRQAVPDDAAQPLPRRRRCRRPAPAVARARVMPKTPYDLLTVAVAVALVAMGAPSWLALLAGLALAFAFDRPAPASLKKWTSLVLQWGVIGLGAGMNLAVVLRVGAGGAWLTALSLALTFGVGALLGRALHVPRDTSLLLTVGTAICGGSAIAAVGSVMKPKSHEMSVALGVVFMLNALALVVFPPLGHAAGLSQEGFGRWAALAIHDTSSVVGAALSYGPEALEVATTTKLARALWIVPLTLGVAFTRQRDDPGGLKAVKWPWFIAGFLVAAALFTWVPDLAVIKPFVAEGAKRLLVLALYLIGLSLSRQALRTVGWRPLAQGVLLWLVVGSAWLAYARLAG